MSQEVSEFSGFPIAGSRGGGKPVPRMRRGDPSKMITARSLKNSMDPKRLAAVRDPVQDKYIDEALASNKVPVNTATRITVPSRKEMVIHQNENVVTKPVLLSPEVYMVLIEEDLTGLTQAIEEWIIGCAKNLGGEPWRILKQLAADLTPEIQTFWEMNHGMQLSESTQTSKNIATISLAHYVVLKAWTLAPSIESWRVCL
jgi:hypothetical protein